MSTTHIRRKQGEGTTSATEDARLAEELVKLNQPWNPVVQCAVGFLKTPSQNKKQRAWLKKFSYAARVFQGGAWQCNDLPPDVKGTAIGIILKGRVEVVLEKPISPPTGISPVRPCPVVTLLPGNVIGSFEYTDRFFHSTQSYGYSLFAGPVCIQFDHPDYYAFASDRAGFTELEKALKTLDENYAESPRNSAFCDWQNTGENYHLVKAFADAEELKNHHAVVLVISADAFSTLSDATFNRAIIGEAWSQSGTPLSRTFPVPIRRDSPLTISDKIDPRYAHDMHSTILHVEAAIQDDVPVWTPFHSDYDAPALDSFCMRLSDPKIDARVRLKREKVYITNVLSDAKTFGSVTLADHLVKVSGQLDGNTRRYKWNPDELASAQERSPLFRIEGDFKHFLHPIPAFNITPPWNNKVKLRSWGDQQGFSGKTIERIKISDENPFSRLQIEISSAPDRLDVLNRLSLERELTAQSLSGVLIVACQHLLKETECWFHHLKEINPDVPIMTIGKDYLTCQEISRRLIRRGIDVLDNFEWDWKPGRYGDYLHKKAEVLWQKAREYLTKNPIIQKVIILDDGAFLISSLPRELRSKVKIVAVEQTQRGITKAQNRDVPLINVAECKIKKRVESHFIAKVSLQKAKGICRSLCDKMSQIGIIGNGAVGEALAAHLDEVGYTNVYSYDHDPQKRTHKKSAQSAIELVDKCDIFFGCSGEDSVLSEVNSTLVAGKWFISCSSSDSEFSWLLQSAGAEFMLPYYKFSTVLVPIKGKDPAKILNGGFPINFDRTPESVPLNEIQLTRGLMHAGLIQALDKTNHESSLLSNDLQRDVLDAWLAQNTWPQKVREIAIKARAALR